MRVLEYFLGRYIERMSPEEKEAMLARVVEKFLQEMTAEDKQRLVERFLPQLLDEVDMRAIVSQLLLAFWKGSEKQDISPEEEAGLWEAFSRMASGTGGKLKGVFDKFGGSA